MGSFEYLNFSCRINIYVSINDYSADLTGNKQISELEVKCASLGDELQRRFLCPRCHQDNSESLDVILQTI